MRIIKTRGRSVVVKEVVAKETEATQEKLKRKLIPNAKARHGEREASVDISDYLSGDEKFFLAQWGSMFDKLFSKHNKPYRTVYNARETAGEVFFEYWKKHNLLTEFPDFDEVAFKSKWMEYVHPYDPENVQNDPEDEDEKPVIIKPWFKAITKIVAIDNVSDWKDVAEAVYQHLYQKQETLKPIKGKTHEKGLVERKTKAIENNVRQYEHKGDSFNSQSQTDKQHIQSIQQGIFNSDNPYLNNIKDAYKLDELSEELGKLENKATETNNHLKDSLVAYPKYSEVIACFKNHYEKIFGKKPISEVRLDEDQKENWFYHCLIQSALKQQYSHKRIHFQRRKRGKYPITADSLHKLAIAIETNRSLNFAIRLGKTIHYEAGKQDKTALELATGNNIDHHNQIIAESSYWQSAGQTEIKQKEAFVRHWLGAIASATITLERLLDPESTVLNRLLENNANADFLTETPFIESLRTLTGDQAAQFQVDEQCKLLFGKNHELYHDNGERIAFFILLRVILAQLRHASYHYKSIDEFVEVLDNINNFKSNGVQNIVNSYINKRMGNEFPDLNKSQRKRKRKELINDLKPHFEKVICNVNKYIIAHQQKQRELAIETLRSAHVEKYLTAAQIRKLIEKTVDNNTKSLLTLPRFNRLLKRAKETHNKPKGTETLIIKPPSVEANQQAGYHCGFISLKRLYENDFPAWLEQQNATTLNQYQNTASERTKGTQQGNAISKTVNLRAPKANENIKNYFSYIAQEMAQEASLQQSKNRYQSSKSGAQEHSNFVENFKMDFLIQAFHDYLKKFIEANLGKRLRELGTAITPQVYDRYLENNLDEIAKQPNQQHQELKRPWIYMILHLVPIEFVNHLSLQIKKQHVLTRQTGFSQIAEAISLYLDMHDAGLELTLLHEDDGLKAFFNTDTHKQFSDLFGQTQTEDNALIPVRGLREILRFGNLAALQQLFKEQKVTKQDCDDLEKLKTKIADHQSNRQINHATLIEKGANNLNMADNKRYNEDLMPIIRYRQLKNKIYLHNPKQAHQLIMALIGRLISYAQLYERDIYFVMLSLLFLEKKQLDAEQDKSFIKNVSSGQVITAIVRSRKDKDVYSEDIMMLCQKLDKRFQIQTNKATRNDLAHINYLRPVSGSVAMDFTDIINKVRSMMRYDRKLKNAVAKSVIDLFARHDFIVSFTMTNHQLALANISSKIIYHLGTNKKSNPSIAEALHSDEFVKVIKGLFGNRS